MNSYSLNDSQVNEQIKDVYAHPEKWTLAGIIFTVLIISLIIFVCYKIIPVMLKRKRVSENN